MVSAKRILAAGMKRTDLLGFDYVAELAAHGLSRLVGDEAHPIVEAAGPTFTARTKTSSKLRDSLRKVFTRRARQKTTNQRDKPNVPATTAPSPPQGNIDRRAGQEDESCHHQQANRKEEIEAFDTNPHAGLVRSESPATASWCSGSRASCCPPKSFRESCTDSRRLAGLRQAVARGLHDGTVGFCMLDRLQALACPILATRRPALNLATATNSRIGLSRPGMGRTLRRRGKKRVLRSVRSEFRGFKHRGEPRFLAIKADAVPKMQLTKPGREFVPDQPAVLVIALDDIQNQIVGAQHVALYADNFGDVGDGA